MKSLKLLAAAAALVATMPVGAAMLTYTITGAYTATFQLDTHPDVLVDPSDPDAFFIFDVPGTFAGHAGLAGITFYSLVDLGGLGITFLNPDTNVYDIPSFTGDQLYTGPESSPTLLAFGPTVFPDYDDPTKSYTVSAVLSAAVPEPATWAMLIGGFAFAGLALRRRPAMATVSFR